MADKKMPQERGQAAWLVTWEWSGDHAAVEDRVAAILKPRLSRRVLAEIVERIYARHAYAPFELAALARKPTANHYGIKWTDNEVGLCGDNPWLRVARVRDLVVKVDPETGAETNSWILPARSEMDPKGDRPRQARGLIPESAQRTIRGPLSDREIGRHPVHLALDPEPTSRPT